MDNKYLVKTECKHNFCICCITKVNNCPLCRKYLITHNLCSQIRIRYVKIKRKKEDMILLEIVRLFDILPNYIDNLEINCRIIVELEYVYLSAAEIRKFSQIGHEYVIEQI